MFDRVSLTEKEKIIILSDMFINLSIREIFGSDSTLLKDMYKFRYRTLFDSFKKVINSNVTTK